MNALPLLAVIAALVSPPPEQPNVSQLVADLRSDDIPGNAERAFDSLTRMVAERESGEAADHLNRAMASDDAQQRLLATILLAKWESDRLTLPMWETLMWGMSSDWDIPTRVRAWEALCRRWPEGTEGRLGAMVDCDDLALRIGLLSRTERWHWGRHFPPEAVEGWWRAAEQGPLDLDGVLAQSLGQPVPARHFAALALVRRRGANIGPDVSRALVDSLVQNDVVADSWQVREVLGDLPPPWPDHLLEALEGALDSEDHQQSQIAAVLLTPAMHRNEWSPTERYWEVIVVGLINEARDDSTVFRGRTIPRVRHNQGNAIGALSGHPDQGTAPLVGALDSDNLSLRQEATRILIRRGCREPVLAHWRTLLDADDASERLWAAVFLARARDLENIDRITEILLLNLADDRVGGNANAASRALQRLGDEAIPWIEPFRDWPGDPQVGHMVSDVIIAIRLDQPRLLLHPDW